MPRTWRMAQDHGRLPARRGYRRSAGRRVRDQPRACRPNTATAACVRRRSPRQAIIGAGIGAALVGMRPIAEIMFFDFAGVCLDQIANHAAKQRYMSGAATHVPLTIRMMVGGGMGGFGAQHSQSLEAWLLHTPGLKVVYPEHAVRRQGPAAQLHLRRGSLRPSRIDDGAARRQGGSAAGGLSHPARRRQGAARRHRHHA